MSTASDRATTSSPPPTTLPGAAAVAEACEILASGTWDERRGVILTRTAPYLAAGGTEPLVDRVRASCPDDLARQEAATTLEQRAFAVGDALDSETATVTPTWVSCTDGTMVVRVDVATGERVGAVADSLPNGVDAPAASAAVFWDLPPDARQFTLPLGAGTECVSFEFGLFILDDTGADTALPNGPGPATTGDDPSDWLLSLLQSFKAVQRDPGDPARHDAQDVRGILRVFQPGEIEGDPDVQPVLSATVCRGTINQPDADRIAFAYVVEYAPTVIRGVHYERYDELQHAAFRRGSDGRWRLLVVPSALDGTVTGAGCTPVDEQP